MISHSIDTNAKLPITNADSQTTNETPQHAVATTVATTSLVFASNNLANIKQLIPVATTDTNATLNPISKPKTSPTSRNKKHAQLQPLKLEKKYPLRCTRCT